MAGSGLHLHLAIERDGRNVMHDASGDLSDEALRLVGGILSHASTLAAFGNTVAASYLRLVPGQEAPTRICWGRHNRSSLVRIPLSFRTAERMDRVINPAEAGPYPPDLGRPTVEYRSPDGSAFVHELLAAVTICAAEGLVSPETAELARRLEVRGNIYEQPELLERLDQLPATAMEAARRLRASRGFFEERGFPPRLIDVLIEKLEGEEDIGLSAKLRALPAAQRLSESRRLMHKDLHKH
jgi:glutamine synthetase